MRTTQQYKCPSCGAAITFEPSLNRFKCKYCDSGYTTEQIEAIFPDDTFDHIESVHTETNDSVSAEERDKFAEYNSLYNCPSCGAAIVTDVNTAATSCYYCHNPVVLAGKLTGDFRPSSLLPFKYNEAAAKQKFSEFTRRRLFLPKGFKEAVLNEITGIYIPYWLATCDTGGTVVFDCKKVRTWRTGNTEHTETKVYAVTRSAESSFTRIPHDASSKSDDILMENLEPYDYREIADFNMRYLSGFFADKYDVNKERCYPRIRKRAVDGTVTLMRDDITGYTSVDAVSVNVDVRQCNWEHMLFPVWFLAYKYGDKMYRFAMNGQTGRFAGNLPVSSGRVAAAVGVIVAVAAALAAVISVVCVS